jgi:hypothetical protein
MTNIPDALNFIQTEETSAYAPVAESTLFKVGGSMNYLLNHYPIPPGTIHAFFGLETNIPPGFLVADGRTFSRTGEANLFAAIGTLGGVGDGLTTANTPDCRGLFVRGVDLTSSGQAGRDPDHAGRTPTGTGSSEQAGSFEADIVGAHNHYIPTNAGGAGASLQGSTGVNPMGTPTETGGTTGIGAETRPKNLYVLYIIKT